MYRFFLSLRYLRARKTNWIGMAGIFVGVTALILILSIMSGFLNESRKHLRGNLSDVLVQPMLDYPIKGKGAPRRDVDALLEIVRSDPRVAASAPQMVWYGMISAENKEFYASDQERGGLAVANLVGIDVEAEFAATDLRESMLREPAPGTTTQRPADVDDPFAPPPGYQPRGFPAESIIVGERLGAAWGLQRGAEVEIVTATIDPESGRTRDPINQTFVVAGTFRSSHNSMDLERIYFDRRVLADWLGREDDAFSQVLVKLHDYEGDKRAITEDLGVKLHQAGFLHSPESPLFDEVKTWEAFRRTLLAAIENEKSLMGIMLSLVMIVAGFCVFAILSMMVSEKRRDIGILCALGGTPKGIMSLFLLIAFWEALIGASLGVVAGVWGALRIDSIERWLSAKLNFQIFDRKVYLFDHIPSVIQVTGVAWIVAGALVCTLAFAMIPAWRAAKLDPVEALRFE
ncbi:MAG: ABC transporter permease [bacterium]|nr:ABC transporter permease [bacterium]